MSDSRTKIEFNPAELISTVTGASGDDYIGIALGSAHNRYSPKLCQLDDDVLYGPGILNSNFWFCGSVLDGQGFKKENCLWTESIIADVDYGTEGHQKPSPFETMEAALTHMLSIAIKPSFISCSGHGFQPVYLLKGKCVYAEKVAEVFHDAKLRLYQALRSDCTSSPAAMFRVPGSVNDKSRLFPDLAPVRSYIVQPLDLSVRYSPQEIIDALPPVPRRVSPRAVSQNLGTEVKVPPDFTNISQRIKDMLACNHEPGTRSESFFCAVRALYNHGFGVQDIEAVIRQLPWALEKYENRLVGEIERCLSKPFIADQDETVVYPKALNKIVRLETV